MALTEIKTAGLADDAVTGAKIADDTVAEANMANDAISLTELKAGTDGQVITYDASGNPTAVGPGTDGQVLTSTGAGSPPAFESISIPAGTTINNNADNRVITGSGTANTLEGEANLTYNGTALNLAGTNSEIHLMGSGTCDHSIAAPSGTNDVVVTANKDAENVTANIVFKSSGSGGGAVSEKARIDSAGRLQVNQTANITGQAKLEVTADGSNANPEYSYGIGVTDTQAYNVSNGPGVGIGFNIKYNNGGSTALIGGIRGYKVNTTDGNYSGGMQFYTRANGAGAAKAMQIDDTGAVLKPKHPMASVYVAASDDSGGHGNKIGNSICVYNAEHFDIGGNYDTSNGRFTCPITGIYRVSVSGNLQMANYAEGDWYDIQIWKNNSVIQKNYNYARGENWEYQGFSSLLQFAKDDYIQIALYGHNGQTMGWDATAGGQWHRAQFELVA